MNSRLSQLLFSFALCFFIIVGDSILLSAAGPIATKILVSLDTYAILTPQQNDNIREAFQEFAASEKGREDIVELSSEIFIKLKTDRDELRDLLRNINLLIEEPHTQKIHRIKSKAFTASWQIVQNLDQCFDDSHLDINQRRRNLSDEDYMQNVRNNLDCLVGSGHRNSIAELWKSIQTDLEPIYPYWNEEYAQLQERRVNHQEHLSSMSNIFNHGEMNFIRIFADISSTLRRISINQSKQF